MPTSTSYSNKEDPIMVEQKNKKSEDVDADSLDIFTQDDAVDLDSLESNNSCVFFKKNMESKLNSDESDQRTLLTSVDLRNNRLKGSIILGNYEYLSVLDVSHNAIEVLVVSALRGLQELNAAHNALRHLAMHGASLRYLGVNNNQLENIATTVPPSNLIRINISNNKFSQLPSWINLCSDLTTLHASFNHVTEISNELFRHSTQLQSLNLAHNKITCLPPIEGPCHFEEFLLHNNSLHSLPESFFVYCDSLKLLNLSCNRLNRLPPVKKTQTYCLENIYLTSNCLDDAIFEVLKEFQLLKVMYISYNYIRIFPENCARYWPDLEVLDLSKNLLQGLPDSIANFKYLKLLRAHSNRLRRAPVFSSCKSLRLLDLSHNELEVIKLDTLAPTQLKFLDVSCNKMIPVDPLHFQAYRFQRPMSLIDVTSQTRPLQKKAGLEDYSLRNPWCVGFAESPGSDLELNITQIRIPSFCNKEGLFTVIDGEDDDEIPKVLQNTLPTLLLEEKLIKETSDKYMKYLVLSAHRELQEKGRRKGACLVACHISSVGKSELSQLHKSKKYSIQLINVGHTKAVICKPTGFISLGGVSNNKIGYTSNFPDTLPDPEEVQSVILDHEEFLILGNKGLWREISSELAVKEVKNESNPILAAKRLHDLAHGFGIEENLSVIVVKFDRIKNDVDILMNELKNTIKRNNCKSECCYSQKGTCTHSFSPYKSMSERSSPSGQSERNSAINANEITNRSFNRRNCKGGIARAMRVKVEDEKEGSLYDEALSEEQFKCWEYMLEQNTQVLFDKELDTISKGYTRSARMNGLRNLKGLSGSSPQLHIIGNNNKIKPPFLAKRFGSSRNFEVGFKSDLRFLSSKIPHTGPNAAYFGSLQRLMPYHLEYDFDVIQERQYSDESIDLEGRMQQYWGVTTTEL